MPKKQFNSELFKFALFPNYDSAITFLANLKVIGSNHKFLKTKKYMNNNE